MKRNPDANAEPMDMEDLAKLGNSASGPCPYFLSRDMAANADIVFMPVRLFALLARHPTCAQPSSSILTCGLSAALQYNYLVDPQTRMGMKNVQWRNAILIFDEAHNVEVMNCANQLWSTQLPTMQHLTPAHCRADRGHPHRQGVCSEAASFNLPAPVLTGCINEVEKAYQTAMLRLESQSAQAGAAMTGALSWHPFEALLRLHSL